MKTDYNREPSLVILTPKPESRYQKIMQEWHQYLWWYGWALLHDEQGQEDTRDE